MKRSQIRQALSLTPNLHSVSFLQVLIAGFVAWDCSNSFDLSFLLEIWLEDLQISGIDLDEYGRVEYACFIEFCNKHFFRRRKWDDDSQCWREIAGLDIASFIYGPSPSDWEIKLKEVEETYEIPGGIPGGWVEEDQNQDKDQEQEAVQNQIQDQDEGQIERKGQAQDQAQKQDLAV